MNAQLEARLIAQDQVDAVQRVMESNAQYSWHVSGAQPTPTAASDVLTALPPNVSITQKVDLGLWDGGDLVAFADVLIGWPSSSTAHIGLLMTERSRHGEGLGRQMHDAVLDLVSGRTDVQTLRLSIVDANSDLAEPFWIRLGYESTGEAAPYFSGSVESTARIWARPVETSRMFSN